MGDVTSVGTPKAGVFAERAAHALADRLVAELRGDPLPAGFDRKFCDLWRFYLMYCEGGFRGGAITVSQVTLAKR